MPKVLVTGGSGFIAGHCIKLLLERGYGVITTVRNHDKGAKVVKAHSINTQAELNYQIVEDVAQEGAFDEVVSSTPNLDYVIHTASPFHYNVEDPVRDFLEPAVTGTTSILKAVKEGAPSVKRVVLLSSFAAMRSSDKTPPFYDESCWNPVTWEEAAQDKTKTYQASKTLSERAAWAFIKNEEPAFDLVTINPTLVFGPAAPHLSSGDTDSLNTSNLRILDMVQGKMKDKLEPTGFYSWVDVRDVALAHVRALEVPEAGGKRFLLFAGYHSNKKIAEIIATMGPEFREMLPVDLDAEEDDLPSPDERYGFNNRRSFEVLGIAYTPLETTVKDTVQSLLKLNA